MKYKNVIQGKFISRPNRFIAKVLVDGNEETVHVKNTGRCKEFFIPGARVYLSLAENTERKTKYDLIAAEKKTENGTILINADSQIPNLCVEEFLYRSELFSDKAIIRREVTYGSSRFDICVKDKNKTAFIEVKGVTLERNGIAMFPDAPTLRGVKHINELIKAKSEGYDAYIFFVIQMTGITAFTPNSETHPEFSEALKKAYEAGVKILAFECRVTPDSIEITNPVKTVLH